MSHVDGKNQQPKPFRQAVPMGQTADQILHTVKRLCQRVYPDDDQTNF